MANQDELKSKMLLLATRVKKSSITAYEDIKIDRAVKSGAIKNRADVRRVLEESLNKTASEIDQVFAGDNTDKLVDEILRLLGK